jgi:hypothetical protein
MNYFLNKRFYFTEWNTDIFISSSEIQIFLFHWVKYRYFYFTEWNTDIFISLSEIHIFLFHWVKYIYFYFTEWNTDIFISLGEIPIFLFHWDISVFHVMNVICNKTILYCNQCIYCPYKSVYIYFIRLLDTESLLVPSVSCKAKHNGHWWSMNRLCKVPKKNQQIIPSVFAFLCGNVTNFLEYMTLQYKHNILTLLWNIEFICASYIYIVLKQEWKVCFSSSFLISYK